MTTTVPTAGDEERLVERLRAEVEYDNDEPNGPGEVTYGRVFLEAADTIARLVAERDEAVTSASALEGISHLLDDELSACKEEVERLRDALVTARAYVLQAVNDDGGIDNCEIGDRLALERIDAILEGAKP